MKLKYFAPFLVLAITSSAYAAEKNYCDELIEAGRSTPGEIKDCQDQFGVSDYYKEQEAQRAKKSQEGKIETAKKENIEVKEFKGDEFAMPGKKPLKDPFFAELIDYRTRIVINGQRKPKVERLTEGDDMCKYLGYEKALQSTLSPEIMPEDADKKGIVITKKHFWSKPELGMYHDDDMKFTVKKYVSITCARLKDKNDTDSQEELKKIAETVIYLEADINPQAKKDPSAGKDDGPRNGGGKTTPGGYHPPVWTTPGTGK